MFAPGSMVLTLVVTLVTTFLIGLSIHFLLFLFPLRPNALSRFAILGFSAHFSVSRHRNAVFRNYFFLS